MSACSPLNALHLALQLVTSNITQYYTSRTIYNTPEQWVSKLVFSAQNQGYGDVVTQTNPVTIQLTSGQPLTIPITNATTNATCESGCSPRTPGQHCSLPRMNDPALSSSRMRHPAHALLPPAPQHTALHRDSALRGSLQAGPDANPACTVPRARTESSHCGLLRAVLAPLAQLESPACSAARPVAVTTPAGSLPC